MSVVCEHGVVVFEDGEDVNEWHDCDAPEEDR